jgi:hypothetical protein
VEDHVAFKSHVALVRLGVQREEILQRFGQLKAIALAFDHVLNLGSILQQHGVVKYRFRRFRRTEGYKGLESGG